MKKTKWGDGRGGHGKVQLTVTEQDAKRIQWLLEHAVKMLTGDHKASPEMLAAAAKLCEAVQAGWRNVERSDGGGLSLEEFLRL